MTTIALWLLLGAPAPSPMPTTAPPRPDALAEGSAPLPTRRSERTPFLRPGVRVVAGGAESGEESATGRLPLP